MIRCAKCILPDTFPGIEFDERGVCNYCSSFEQNRGNKEANLSIEEEMLIKLLRGYISANNKYDVLVPLSGGVDSSSALINIVEKYGLRPLAFHNDHGFEDNAATDNVRKLCSYLNVDLILWKHDCQFMKKLWKYFNECGEKNLNVCYICGNILYLNAIELADRFNIPLIINGYSKGQAELIQNKEHGREMLQKMIDVIQATGDSDFFNEFIKKYDYLKRQKIIQAASDINSQVDRDKILIIPFFLFEFYKTNKEELKNTCTKRFDWQPMRQSYPARSTNCDMVWLNTFCDLKKKHYSIYDVEYSTLIREEEISREQALKDLEFIPPEGLIEYLAEKAGIDLGKVGRQKEAGITETEKVEIEFEF